MRKAAPSATAVAAPRGGGGAPDLDLFERLAAPFDPAEVRTRQGPRGPLRYVTARTVRRRLNAVVGTANWTCRIEPADRWVRCALTIILPDGREITREALGGYPDMPTDGDKVKGCDSDSFMRSCVFYSICEYLYGDEPAEPSPSPAPPTSNGDGRGEPRNVPRDRISFPDARAFYGWLKDNGHLDLAAEIAGREGFPTRIVHWTPEQIDLATVEILERTRGARS